MQTHLSVCEQASNSDHLEADSIHNVAEDSINTDPDFNSKVFESDYVSKPAPSPHEHTKSGHTGTFNVRQFVAICQA